LLEPDDQAQDLTRAAIQVATGLNVQNANRGFLRSSGHNREPADPPRKSASKTPSKKNNGHRDLSRNNFIIRGIIRTNIRDTTRP
jgi:hypothetical protein